MADNEACAPLYSSSRVDNQNWLDAMAHGVLAKEEAFRIQIDENDHPR